MSDLIEQETALSVQEPCVFLALPTGGNIKPCAAHAITVCSGKGLRVKPRWEQFGDIPHNFNTLWCEALMNRPTFTHFAMLHDDCAPVAGWLDTLLEEMDRVNADVMSTVLCIKDHRGLTTTGIRYPGTWGTRRYTMRELWRLPETFSIEDTAEPDKVLAIGTACWICKLPQAGWVDKFPGFQNEHKIVWNGGEPSPCFDSEDWLFPDWLASQGLRVFATRKVHMGHQGAAFFTNNQPYGTWETELQPPTVALNAPLPDPGITIETAKPIAIDSMDHTHPLGARIDSSSSAAFNRKLFELIPANEVRLLDLGCSGGGFVRSILDAGGFAVGVEGSDFSLKRKRAEWGQIPEYLFTADCTEPFTLRNGTPEPIKFNVITGWEMLEHIPEDKIEAVIENIRRHASDEALFIGSISQSVEPHHVTAKPKQWWIEHFEKAGWRWLPGTEGYFGQDMVRGLGPEEENISYSVVCEIS